MSEPYPQLGADAIAAFEADGLVVLDRVIDDETVGRVLEAMQRVYRNEYRDDRRPPRVRRPLHPFGTADSIHWMLNARVLDGDLWQVATERRLGAMAAALLRTPSVSIVEDQLLAKPPRGLPVNIHQDYAYWPFARSTQLITCWIALVDVGHDMGPLELLPGSHRWGRAPRPPELIVGSEEGWLDAVRRVRPEGELQFARAAVPAGGGVFFHSLLFHGSKRNATERWRRAFSLHWAADECRVDLGAVAHHDYPYFFSGLQNHGPIVNKFMPRVYPAYAEHG